MYGLGRNNFKSSMTPVYLLLLIFIANQFLFIHSYVVIHNDQDQNTLENFRQLIDNSIIKLEDLSSDNNDLQALLRPTVQRRFCCMSPLSGRKRFVRDLARKQQLSNVFIQ